MTGPTHRLRRFALATTVLALVAGRALAQTPQYASRAGAAEAELRSLR